MILAPVIIAASLIAPVSANGAMIFDALPCRVDNSDALPTLRRTDDNVVRLDGAMFARKKMALGYRYAFSGDEMDQEPDEDVRRALISRFVPLAMERDCSEHLEGPP